MKSNIKKRFNKLEKILNKHHLATFWAVLATAFVLIISRRPDILFHAQFWAEDGKIWYADAYNHGLHSLLYGYAGYVISFYRLIALLALAFPLRYVPLFFGLVAVCLQLTPLILLNSNRLRRIVPYRSLAIILSLMYVGVLNANEVFGNVANTQWHLGVASFLVLVAAASTSKWWRAFDVSILLATGLSGPLLIILWPIAALLWWRDRTPQHKQNVLLVSGLALLQIVTIFFISTYHRVGGQPDASFKYLVEMIVGQIFTGGLLGQPHVSMFYGHSLRLAAALIAGLSLIIYAVWKAPLWLKLLDAFGAIVFGAMLFSLKPVAGLNLWWGLANPGGGQRYWYIPILAWVATLVWLLLCAKNIIPKLAAGALLALLLVFGIPGSWRMVAPPDLHFQKYANNFETVKPGTKYVIPTNPAGWSLELTKK